MLAKCPHCDAGCPKCTDGYVDVSLPDASNPDVRQFAKVCNDCGCSAGGGFIGPGLPFVRDGARAVCPCCGGQNLRIEFV